MSARAEGDCDRHAVREARDSQRDDRFTGCRRQSAPCPAQGAPRLPGRGVDAGERRGDRWPVLALAFATLALAGTGCGPSQADASLRSEDAGDAGSALGDGSFNVPPGPATTIPLVGCVGPGYAADFTIGSQTFQLSVDTGSGTLAVASSACASCGVDPDYTPGPGAQDQHARAFDTYLQGSWQGEIVSDSTELVGTGMPVPLRLAAIDTQSAFFDNAGCGLGTLPFAPEGIAGFGPSDLAISGTDAFFPALTRTGTVRSIFAIELCPQGGQLMIGGVDPVKGELSGPAVYTPMTIAPYYDVTLDDLQLSGTSLGYRAADFGATAVDTGTSVLALPPAIFRAMTSSIEGNAAFTKAFGGKKGWFGTTMCFTSFLTTAQLDDQLPPLTLGFPGVDGGTTALTLSATESYLPPTPSDGLTYYCSGLLENDGTKGTILGTAGMLGHMVIFDLVDGTIGFAPQRSCQ
jgi:hypothetical protein